MLSDVMKFSIAAGVRNYAAAVGLDQAIKEASSFVDEASALAIKRGDPATAQAILENRQEINRIVAGVLGLM